MNYRSVLARLVVFAFVSFWAAGCYYDHSVVISDAYVVSIDPTFSASERATILDGINKWRGPTPVEISWSDRCPEIDGRVCYHNSNRSEIVANGGTKADIGLTLEGCGDIYLDTQWLNTHHVFDKAAMHEFGHAMGLHHNGPGNAMSAVIEKMASTITCEDAAQWYEIRSRPAPTCESP